MQTVLSNWRRAPEQADPNLGPRGSHTKVWIFATLVLHLATGQVPYDSLTPMQITAALMRRQPPAAGNKLPEWLQCTLGQCLSFDAATRPSVMQLLQVSKSNSHAGT